MLGDVSTLRSLEKYFVCSFYKLIFGWQGAPETIQERLVDVPSTYVETYKKYTRQGSRVLALAYRPLPDMTVSLLGMHLSLNSVQLNYHQFLLRDLSFSLKFIYLFLERLIWSWQLMYDFLFMYFLKTYWHISHSIRDSCLSIQIHSYWIYQLVTIS